MAEVHAAGVWFEGRELWITPNQQALEDDMWNLMDDAGKVYASGTVKQIQNFIVEEVNKGRLSESP